VSFSRLRMRVVSCWLRAWYSPHLVCWLWPLLPFSWLVAWVAQRRYRRFCAVPKARSSVPVVVVGNLTAGGVGKTPLVAALAGHFRQQGYKPAIVSRGYGVPLRTRRSHPVRRVTADSDPRFCGDEPVMLARDTDVPVMVGADRRLAVETLLQTTDCDLVISDDGLQHYGLQRDIELVVMDGQRRFGNGWCLPAGPLREPVTRLADVDWVICKEGQPPAVHGPRGLCMRLKPGCLLPVAGCETAGQMPRPGAAVSAVAGIGHPAPFFESLEKMGFDVTPCPFPDHHSFTLAELESLGTGPLIMTAKDAVKCRAFARPGWWYLTLDVQLPDFFWRHLQRQLAQLRSV